MQNTLGADVPEQTFVTSVATWRELLGKLLANPEMKEKIVTQMGDYKVSHLTLTRWATGATKSPHASALKALSSALSEYERLFQELISKEFPGIFDTNRYFSVRAIELAEQSLINEILVVWQRVPLVERRTTICRLTLRYLVDMLAPNQYGVGISVNVCIVNRQRDQPIVLAFRPFMVHSVTPFSSFVMPMMLGKESATAYAAQKREILILETSSSMLGVPVRQDSNEDEKSVAVFPIRAEGKKIAGCVVINSTERGFFNSEIVSNIERIIRLIGLGFQEKDYFAPDQFHLVQMPSVTQQQQMMRNIQKQKYALREQLKISSAEAEDLVYVHLAESLQN